MDALRKEFEDDAFLVDELIDRQMRCIADQYVHLRNAAEMALALEWYGHGLDFADALHLAQAAHCTRLVTFDRRFVARAERISGVRVALVNG